jgi:hypothetical protein
MTLPGIGDPAYPTNLDDLNRLAWVNGTANTADVASVSTTEGVLVTAPSYTYEANMAYQVQLGGLVRISAASPNTPMFQLRKTNATGATLGPQGRWPVVSTGTNHGFNLTWHFQVGGTAVSAALCATLTGTASYVATCSGTVLPTWINIYKVENATNLSWAPTLV